MKSIFAVMLLSIIGCTHKPLYKAGDCLKFTFKHDFENEIYYNKIEKVGPTEYKYYGRNSYDTITQIDGADYVSQVDCKEAFGE